jgi:hypothetical protein
LQGIDWDRLRQRAVEAPYRPHILLAQAASEDAGLVPMATLDESRPYEPSRWEHLFVDFEQLC